VLGCAVGAVGFYLWGSKLDTLSFANQWYYLAIGGAGTGLVLGPVSADALNRAARAACGAVTGITQTVRYFGGSLGLAVPGSILITETTSRGGDNTWQVRRPNGPSRQHRPRDLRGERRRRYGRITPGRFARPTEA